MSGKLAFISCIIWLLTMTYCNMIDDFSELGIIVLISFFSFVFFGIINLSKTK